MKENVRFFQATLHFLTQHPEYFVTSTESPVRFIIRRRRGGEYFGIIYIYIYIHHQ